MHQTRRKSATRAAATREAVGKARAWFYSAYFESGTGQVVFLARPEGEYADALAMCEVMRQFDPDEYPGIVLEPSRASLQLQGNTIFLGCFALFHDPYCKKTKRGPAWAIGEKLGGKLGEIEEECCYELTDCGIKNRVTGEEHRARTIPGEDVEYGVIRRAFRSFDNTIIIEGTGSLGTAGAGLVATNGVHLAAIRNAYELREKPVDSQWLEILVQAAFDRKATGGYSRRTIRAQPVALVYGRDEVLHWGHGGRWEDQHPWQVDLVACGTAKAAANRTSPPPQRLEIRADLGKVEAGVAVLLDKLARAPSGLTRGELESILDIVVHEQERFTIELCCDRWRAPTKLPNSRAKAQDTRTRHLLLVAFSRLAGRQFHATEKTLRRYYPDISEPDVVRRFQQGVPGKMRQVQTFAKLLGEGTQRGFMTIECEKSHYGLRTHKAGLVVKLRYRS